ncbi:MAG: DUF2232 domain-containing protein [Nitrospinae bacterium]|nr:DUF2232 domain-containing protein [Nitrospinota bacterium]
MLDNSQLKELLLPAALVFGVTLAVLIFPPMAALVGMVAPAPLLFVYLQRGQVVGLVLMGLVFAVLFATLGAGQALLFVAEYVVMATIMAETIKAQLTMDKCIFLSALGSMTLATFLMFVLFADRENSLTDFFQAQIMQHFDQSMETFKSMGEKQVDLDAMKEFFEQSSRTFASAYPAFIMVGSLITATVNYFLVRMVWMKFYGDTLFRKEKLSELVLPDFLIWGLILSAGSLFFIETPVGMVGMNLFAMAMLVYLFQGLAILVHILESKGVPKFLWGLVFFIIIIQPILMGLLIGLGIFDIWVDFRKIKQKQTEHLEQ